MVNLVVAMGIGAGLWMLFEGLRNNRFRILRLCGENMMEIYLTHVFVAAGIRMVLSRLGLANLVLSILINFTVSMTLPIVGSMLLKKLGIHAYIFKTYSTLAVRKK